MKQVDDKKRVKLKRKHPDYYLLVCALLILAFGVIMIYSSSTYKELQYSSDRHKLLYDTLRWDAIGAVVLVAAMLIRYDLYKKWNYLLVWSFYIITTFALILVMFTPLNRGVHRWITFGNYQFQPSELAKLSMIMALAAYLDRYLPWKRKWKPMLVHFGVLFALIALPSLLIYIEPNKSAAIVVAAIAFTVLFVDGANVFLVGGTGLIGLGLAYLQIKSAGDYAQRRLDIHMETADRMDDAWQISQSLIAFGLGGIRGVGLGNGTQNKLWLPDIWNDFILGNVAEELGLLGTAGLLLLYLFLIYRCIKVAMNAPDRFASLVVSGITVMLSIHIFLNYAVTTKLVPTTGITLPLVSYGGTSTVVFMGCIGLVLGISMFEKQEVTE